MNELLGTAINEILAQQRYIIESINQIKARLNIDNESVKG